MSSTKRVRAESPRIQTSNNGRRFVDVRDILKSEAGREEIRKQAASGSTDIDRSQNCSDPHPTKG